MCPWNEEWIRNWLCPFLMDRLAACLVTDGKRIQLNLNYVVSESFWGLPTIYILYLKFTLKSYKNNFSIKSIWHLKSLSGINFYKSLYHCLSVVCLSVYLWLFASLTLSYICVLNINLYCYPQLCFTLFFLFVYKRSLTQPGTHRLN